MQQKQGTGIDTRMMIPVYAAIFCVLCQWWFPWISIPALKYSRLVVTYRIFQMDECLQNIQTCIQSGGRLPMPLITTKEMVWLKVVISILQGGAVLSTVLMIVCGAVVIVKKEQSKKIVKAAFALQLLIAIFPMVLVILGNVWINIRMGRANTFVNLSVHSYIQFTSWGYGQILVISSILAFNHRLLGISQNASQIYEARVIEKDRCSSKRKWLAAALLLIGIPFVILFGIFFLNDRSSVFIGLCIICLSMLPFAMVFEGRKPQARELLLIAVMSGIAVVGRMAFFMLPQFKPITAVVIIAGVGLGAEAGFLTGAMSGFVSNFFFGQGPWTPWQMFAYGIIGFLAGAFFHQNKWLKQLPETARRLIECAYGGAATFGIYGLIMDVSSVLNFSSGFSLELMIAKIISGVPFNLIHAISTIVFLWVLARPMEKKLERVKKKYGILEV